MGNFSLFKELGTITVPSDYIHGMYVSLFRSKGYPNCGLHEEISDDHFGNTTGVLPPGKRRIASWKKAGNPSRVLRPGEVYSVAVYSQEKKQVTSPSDRLTFLDSVGSVYPGIYGALLLFEQKRGMLPQTFRLLFMDYLEQLPVQSSHYWMPVLAVEDNGSFVFSLGEFNMLRSGNKSLLVSFVPV